MYHVEIEQTRSDSEYSFKDTLRINVKSIEEVETIIGLFGDTCKIIISKGGN